MRNPYLSLLLLSALMISQAGAQPTQATEKRELIYCADRMTHEEREAYRTRMRAARTQEEKQELRAAHRAEMQKRAAAQQDVGCDPSGRQWRGGRNQ